MGVIKHKRPVLSTDGTVRPPFTGGAGTVANPMTANLDAAGYNITGMGAVGIAVNDTSTTPQLTVVQSGTGDAGISLTAGGTTWSTIVDNSDSDKWKLQYGGTPALTAANSTGIIGIPFDSGGALRIGASEDLRLGNDGTFSYVRSFTDEMRIGTTQAVQFAILTDSVVRAVVSAVGEVGINKTPTLGRRLDVGTTGQATALYVADADGTLHSPWAGAYATPNISIGTTDQLRIYSDAFNDSKIYTSSGDLYLGSIGVGDTIFVCNGITSGRFDDSVNNAFVVGANVAQTGSRFDVQTTAQAHALYVADGDGTLHFPWSGSVTTAQIEIGSSSQFRLANDGSTSWVYTSTGSLALRQASSSGIVYRCDNASGGDHAFYTRGSSASELRVKITGNGLQLNPVASDPGSPADGDIWITTGGDFKIRANGTTYTITKT